MTTTYKKKTVAQAVMDKSSARDERMYNTIDLKTNIGLENTKDLRADAIRQQREKKRQGYKIKFRM